MSVYAVLQQFESRGSAVIVGQHQHGQINSLQFGDESKLRLQSREATIEIDDYDIRSTLCDQAKNPSSVRLDPYTDVRVQRSSEELL